MLMVSHHPLQEIKDFYQEYGLSSMANIKVGQDVNFKLGSIYKIRTYPSIFVYDHKATLAKAFVGISVYRHLDAVK
jgi:hypothetical protein